MSIETGTPADLLERHLETAYFWGRVVGDGEVTEDGVTVRANDETAARRLAAIAGAEQVDHRIREREYAHDTSVTRREEEYTVQVIGGVGERASASLGLPLGDEPGGYRLDVFDGQRRQLLRGLLEGCGTVCFKSSSGTVGISFVHEDRRLLERVERLLEAVPVEAPSGEIADSSSGGYWFSIDDAAVPAVGPWIYEGSEETGLFSPARRRKLLQSIEQAENVDSET
jgi:hypothetical protein